MSEVTTLPQATPNPKQAQFLVNLTLATFFLHAYIGGVGSGKTFALGKAVESCGVDIPGNVVGVFRKVAKDLMATTYQEFMRNCPPQLIWREYKQEREIDLISSQGQVSRVCFLGLDERDR